MIENNKPLVSLIVPTFNRRRWIGECLDAVSQQTYPNTETLVIDDCSSDGTIEWLRSEQRYAFAQLHVQPQNAGASEARNKGVSICNGELITFIDSDDLLEPEHLETAVRAFNDNPRLGLFCCDARMIGPEGDFLHDGRTWHDINSEIKKYPVRSGLRTLKDVFLFSNSFPGFTLRRDVYEKLGGLDQSIFPLDDYDLALRVAGSGYDVYYCHQPLARYRDHGGNSSGAANGIKVGEQKLRCLQQTLDRFPELRSAGDEINHRIAEVMFEVAVCYAKTGNQLVASRNFSKAIATDPGLVKQVGKIVGRQLRRHLPAFS